MTDLKVIIRKIVIESMNTDTVLKFDPTDRIVQVLSDAGVVQESEQDCKLNLVEIWSQHLQEEHDKGVIYKTFRDQAVCHLQILGLHGVVQLAENQSLPDSPYTGAGVSSFKSSNEEREALASTRGYRMAQGDMSDFKRVKPLMEDEPVYGGYHLCNRCGKPVKNGETCKRHYEGE